jgi:hypothetical protein
MGLPAYDKFQVQTQQHFINMGMRFPKNELW